MKPNTASLALVSALALVLAPTSSPGSVMPSSLTLGWGLGRGLGSSRSSIHVPSLSTTWPMGGRVALWSNIAYMQEQTGGAVVRPAFAVPAEGHGFFPAAAPAHRTYLVPVTMGLRAYARGPETKPRGLFVEAGPSLAFARYGTQHGDSHSAAMGGFQSGVGVRFGGTRGSRTELGMSYHLAEVFGQPRDAIGSIGNPYEVDVSVFAAYVAVGLGD